MSALELRLITPGLALLDAAVLDSARLARMLDAELADGWEVFAGALVPIRAVVADDPRSTRWGTRLFLLAAPPTLVGWGGFKGPPRGGVVELGYAIAPAWRERGLGTAALRAMLADAFAADEVSAVIAHTLAQPGPSVRVLEKAGFARDGDVLDEEDRALWRHRLTRAGYVATRRP
jgi:ribosomal-protein-alanine N-acetyltransferase